MIWNHAFFTLIFILTFFYSMWHGNREWPKNMLLLKKLQFLSDHYETLSKWGSHGYLCLSKFRNDRIKIVDFLIKAYFWPSLDSTGTQCTVWGGGPCSKLHFYCKINRKYLSKFSTIKGLVCIRIKNLKNIAYYIKNQIRFPENMLQKLWHKVFYVV